VNLKIPAAAAGVGALISLIAGLAGGNPFGVVLLRLLASALLAGGLGFGLAYLLKRYLPEILAAPAKPNEAPVVDILIDEEAGPAAPEAALDLEPPDLEPQAEQAVEAFPAEPAEEAAEEAAGLEEELLPDLESPAESPGKLDSLPDLAATSPEARPKGSFTAAQVDDLIKGQDPASLAKAVRSFLKKDREG